jgi:hypothetical protein
LWFAGITIDLPGYGPPPEEEDDMKTTIAIRKSDNKARVLWPWGRTWASSADVDQLMATGQYVKAILDDATWNTITDINSEVNVVQPPADKPFTVDVV